MQDLNQAYRMLDTFSSIGAHYFDVTFLDSNGAKRGFRKEQSVGFRCEKTRVAIC